MNFNITAHYEQRLSKAWLMLELVQRDTYKMSQIILKENIHFYAES